MHEYHFLLQDIQYLLLLILR